jgi:hypothetical protein
LSYLEKADVAHPLYGLAQCSTYFIGRYQLMDFVPTQDSCSLRLSRALIFLIKSSFSQLK